MNIERENRIIEKKEYVAPQMTIVEMEVTSPLLEDSGFVEGGDTDEFDGEFN